MPLTIVWSLFYIGLNLPQASYKLVGYTGDPKYAMCTNTASAAYCRCAISVSDFLEDNDKIFYIFLHAKDTNLFIKMTQDLINGDDYSYYSFRSRKAKSEFVRGKLALFLSEIRRKCE